MVKPSIFLKMSLLFHCNSAMSSFRIGIFTRRSLLLILFGGLVVRAIKIDPVQSRTNIKSNGLTKNSDDKNITAPAKYAPEFKNPTKMYALDMKPFGSSLRFKCAAKGNPTPNITWFKNNDHETLTSRFLAPSYGRWSIELDELTKTDNGNYTCLVCNELGCINHTTLLRVQEPYMSKPFIKEGYPGNITAVVNDTVQLNCPIIITDLEPYLYWLKLYSNYTTQNGEFSVGLNEFSIPDGNQIESDDLNDKPEVLTLFNVTKAYEGWYMCVAINTLGKAASIGYVSIINPPVEVSQQTNKTYQNETNKDGMSTISKLITILVSITMLIATAIISVITVKLKQEKKKKRKAREAAKQILDEQWAKVVKIEKNIDHDTLINPLISIEKVRYAEVSNGVNKSSILTEYILPVDNKWEVLKESLSLGNMLGEGEFGKVVIAECSSNSTLPATVAVKMLKEDHSDEDMVALVSEMAIMKMIGKHENIINLLGCCTQDGPLYVVVEYASNGCLREFLKKHKPNNKSGSNENWRLTPRDLVDFGLQVANGMEYLASRGCIHRDLAARNVLVSGERVLKVADFGLARDVRDSDYYRKRSAGKLPIKWMAPESIARNFYTSNSDVWSFGVLLWEIMTFGCTPYRNVSVHVLYQYLKSGQRMQKPDGCCQEIYSLMMHCWTFNLEDRPQFSDIVNFLKQKLTQY